MVTEFVRGRKGEGEGGGRERDEGRVRVRDSNSNIDDYSDSDIIIKNIREQILEQSRADLYYNVTITIIITITIAITHSHSPFVSHSSPPSPSPFLHLTNSVTNPPPVSYSRSLS